MSPVEDIDLPTMSDMCFGDVCEECRDYNHPDACPCGEPSVDETEAAS